MKMVFGGKKVMVRPVAMLSFLLVSFGALGLVDGVLKQQRQWNEERHQKQIRTLGPTDVSYAFSVLACFSV